jgi:aspartate-semialdehyde dehydrogenase
MTALRDPNRIVIAGASSLLGAELKSLLEESRFAAADFRLVDEDTAAGTLTEAAGEAAVIQPVEEGSFNRARFIFFAGSAAFTRANVAAARAAGGTIIDLSGALAAEPTTVTWFPKLDEVTHKELLKSAPAYAIPSAAATAVAALAVVLKPIGGSHLSFVAFQPVSEAGRAGVEELESQTSQLLSFQSIGKPVFDSQVAFNILDRYGDASAQKLDKVRERIQAESLAAITEQSYPPAIQLLHAPVFYGLTFTASVDVPIPDIEPQSLAEVCKRVGFIVVDGDGPDNVSASGESFMQLGVPRRDFAQPGTWWFYGAADNIRLPAANAVKLADKLAS